MQWDDQKQTLVGPGGSLLVPAQDEVTRKLAMLVEGECEGLGPLRAAEKFGYSKQRYFQLRQAFHAHGAAALQSQRRGPRPAIDARTKWCQGFGTASDPEASRK
jgi:hypothetical protein